MSIKEVTLERGSSYYFVCEDCDYLSLPMERRADAVWAGERHACAPVHVA